MELDQQITRALRERADRRAPVTPSLESIRAAARRPHQLPSARRRSPRSTGIRVLAAAVVLVLLGVGIWSGLDRDRSTVVTGNPTTTAVPTTEPTGPARLISSEEAVGQPSSEVGPGVSDGGGAIGTPGTYAGVVPASVHDRLAAAVGSEFDASIDRLGEDIALLAVTLPDGARFGVVQEDLHGRDAAVMVSRADIDALVRATDSGGQLLVEPPNTSYVRIDHLTTDGVLTTTTYQPGDEAITGSDPVAAPAWVGSLALAFGEEEALLASVAPPTGWYVPGPLAGWTVDKAVTQAPDSRGEAQYWLRAPSGSTVIVTLKMAADPPYHPDGAKLHPLPGHGTSVYLDIAEMRDSETGSKSIERSIWANWPGILLIVNHAPAPGTPPTDEEAVAELDEVVTSLRPATVEQWRAFLGTVPAVDQALLEAPTLVDLPDDCC